LSGAGRADAPGGWEFRNKKEAFDTISIVWTGGRADRKRENKNADRRKRSMGVNAVGFGVPSTDAVNLSGGGGDSRLKALEQKLQKLNQEKEKAVRNHDEEKVKKLEQQIENVKRQIEQLKRKKQKEDKEKKAEEPGEPVQDLPDGPDGSLINRLV